MRLRTHLLAVTLAGLVLPATVAPAPVSAEPLPTGTVQGTARDADDPADPAAPGLQARLYRWDGSAFVPDTDHDPTSTGPNGDYTFTEVPDGFYTVRFSDTTFTYVPTTWPSTTGQMPTTNSTAEGSGVVEVPAAVQPAGHHAQADQAGSVALLLPRLRRGTHRVVAVYGGSRGLYGSTSRSTTLTVVR